MAYTTINKPSEYFNTVTYTGNGSSQTLDMDNLGLLWMKNRTETSNHNLFDVVRGGYYTSAPGPNLRSNGTIAGSGSDITSVYGITFGSSSSTIGSDGGGYNYNQSGKSYVGWQWRANGAGVSNTDGDIASTVSASTTSGFSIVTWSGTSSNGTIGHGLGVAPKVIICFGYSSGGNSWTVGHNSLSWNNGIYLESTNSFSNSALWNNTAPTNDVFSVGSFSGTNSSQSMIAYCFAEKKGFSRFGSYVGTGSDAYAPFIYCGFKPAYVLTKRTDGNYIWSITDGVRNPYNPTSLSLQPEYSDAESGWSPLEVDFLSNGFKLRTSSAQKNGSGSPFIYMAFAEQPLVGTNGVPATAR
jgi:hypothetical protein